MSEPAFGADRMTCREAMEWLESNGPGTPAPDSSNLLPFDLEVAMALDHRGWVEWRSLGGEWVNATDTRGTICGNVQRIWEKGLLCRLSDRGRTQLAAWRVPVE